MSCYNESCNGMQMVSGNEQTTKPFEDWWKWSVSWEGTKTYGQTGGKYAEGMHPGQTEEQAKNRAYREWWASKGPSKVQNGYVAMLCMYCCYWTGNMNCVFQAVYEPNVYYRRGHIPPGRSNLNADCISRLNKMDPFDVFKKIYKQLGYFALLDMQDKYFKGLIRRMIPMVYGRRWLNSNETSKIMNKTEWQNYLGPITIKPSLTA